MEKPDVAELKSMILRHARLQLQYKGEYTGIREMRKQWHGIQPVIHTARQSAEE